MIPAHEIVNLRSQGLRNIDICRQFGIRQDTLSRFMSRHGIQSSGIKGASIPDSDAAKVADMASNGATQSQIAALYDTSAATVCVYMKRHGIRAAGKSEPVSVSHEQDATIRAMCASEATIAQIADAVGIPYSTLYSYMTRERIKSGSDYRQERRRAERAEELRNRPASGRHGRAGYPNKKAIQGRIVDLRIEGKTLREISADLGLSVGMVKYFGKGIMPAVSHRKRTDHNAVFSARVFREMGDHVCVSGASSMIRFMPKAPEVSGPFSASTGNAADQDAIALQMKQQAARAQERLRVMWADDEEFAE